MFATMREERPQRLLLLTTPKLEIVQYVADVLASFPPRVALLAMVAGFCVAALLSVTEVR